MAMILQNATWKSDPIKLIFIRELFVTLPHPRKIRIHIVICPS